MKRARPKQHTRLIKTKKGKKRILVNKGIKRKVTPKIKIGRSRTISLTELKLIGKTPIRSMTNSQFKIFKELSLPPSTIKRKRIKLSYGFSPVPADRRKSMGAGQKMQNALESINYNLQSDDEEIRRAAQQEYDNLKANNLVGVTRAENALLVKKMEEDMNAKYGSSEMTIGTASKRKW